MNKKKKYLTKYIIYTGNFKIIDGKTDSDAESNEGTSNGDADSWS